LNVSSPKTPLNTIRASLDIVCTLPSKFLRDLNSHKSTTVGASYYGEREEQRLLKAEVVGAGEGDGIWRKVEEVKKKKKKKKLKI